MSTSESAATTDPAYVDAVVDSWTQTHTKGTLMMLILLTLQQAPAWSAQVRETITELTGGHMGVDDQSLHRALRRLEAHNIICHTQVATAGTGARRKVFELTRTGEAALHKLLNTTMSYTSHPLFTAARAAAADGLAE